MTYYLSLLISLALLFTQTLSAQSLSNELDSLIQQRLPHATVGVLVTDAQTSQIIYSRNADKLLSPASAMKLFTATAALYQLKPEYHFLTTLSQKNQDIYITFSGAPSLTIANLTDFIRYLKDAGKTTLAGNIILDVTKFKSPDYTAGTSYDDLGWYYAAPDTAVILNKNAVAYDFITAPNAGHPVTIKPKSTNNEITIINQVITVNKDQENNHCALNVKILPNNTLHLFGCLAKNDKPKNMILAVPEPILLAKKVLQQALSDQQIILKGQILIGRTPPDAQILTSISSENLIHLISYMLKESDNLYANSLTKVLGYDVTGEGSHKQGAFAIKNILSQHTHIDLSQTEIADGMGTRYNLTTAEQMVILLRDLYQDSQMKSIIFEALPQAGVSGTLQQRLKKTVLEKRVFAKTGTMHDLSSLSGYMISPHRTYIFSIIINGINTPLSVAKSLEEQILLIINGDQHE